MTMLYICEVNSARLLVPLYMNCFCWFLLLCESVVEVHVIIQQQVCVSKHQKP
jgi:hypothetical protein